MLTIQIMLMLLAGFLMPRPVPPATVADAAAPPSTTTAVAEPAGDAAADPRVVEWLDKFEARGKDIQIYSSDVYLREEDTFLNSITHRWGTMYYEEGREGKSTRFAIFFDRVNIDQRDGEHKRHFIFDGTWFVEKDFKAKLFDKRQVVAPGDEGKFNPIDVDGPFPVPLGQKRDRVLERFEVTLLEDSVNAVEGAVHFRFVPRPGKVAPDSKLVKIELWFDQKTLLPVQVRTEEKASLTTVKLKNPRLNSEARAEVSNPFDTTPPAEGWRVEIKPLK